jgi:hypothetical protein
MRLRLFLFLVTATAAPRLVAQRPGTLPAWTPDTSRAVRIGVHEGAPEYELFDATGSTRLGDGRIVVANAGAREIRYYDARGRYLRTSGRQGGGPGEFRYLRKIYRHTADSLLAADWSVERLSLFDPSGEFVRTVPAPSVGGPALPLDIRLEGPFWVATGAWRVPTDGVRRALRRLPRPDGTPAFRFVLPAADGTLWIAERLAIGDDVPRWIVIDSAGRPVATVDLPPRFELYEAGGDYLLGRWRDEDDVNFIHYYPLVKTASAGPDGARLPAWLRASHPWTEEPVTPEVRAALRGLLRNLVVAQETWFAEHGSYGGDVRLLKLELPPEVAVTIISAGRTGWLGAATHRDGSYVCGMAVGGETPTGWNEGDVVCGSEVRGGS